MPLINKTVLNTTRRSFPLMGKRGVPSRTVPNGGRITVGPEYHEAKHFQSLVECGTFQVIREEVVPDKVLSPQDPKPSSTPRRQKKAAPEAAVTPDEKGDAS